MWCSPAVRCRDRPSAIRLHGTRGDSQSTLSFWRCQGIRKEQFHRRGLVGGLAPQIWIEVTFDLQSIELRFSEVDRAPHEPVLASASAHSGGITQLFSSIFRTDRHRLRMPRHRLRSC